MIRKTSHAIKKYLDHDKLLVAYKLLNDLLLLVLVSFAMILLLDGLVPAMGITGKISFSKMIFLLISNVAMIAYLGKKLGISYKESKINSSKILPALILFSFLLIGNSLLKFTFWENIIITIVTLFIFFMLYEILFASEE